MKTLKKVAFVFAALLCSVAMEAQTDSVKSLRIAFVDVNLIRGNYGLQVELDNKLQAQFKAAQEELNTKQKNIETSVASMKKQIETKANNIQAKAKKTPATGGYKSEAEYKKDVNAVTKLQEDSQSKLEKMQQDLNDLQQKRNDELQAKQAENTKIVLDSISKYIAEYNKDKHYDYILNKENTLYASPQYDITIEVLIGLNRKYKENEALKAAATEQKK